MDIVEKAEKIFNDPEKLDEWRRFLLASDVTLSVAVDYALAKNLSLESAYLVAYALQWEVKSKQEENSAWVVTAKSESGDSYGPYLYHKNPTEEQLTNLAKSLDYVDGDGPGYAGSYVYFTIEKASFEK